MALRELPRDHVALGLALGSGVLEAAVALVHGWVPWVAVIAGLGVMAVVFFSIVMTTLITRLDRRPEPAPPADFIDKLEVTVRRWADALLPDDPARDAADKATTQVTELVQLKRRIEQRIADYTEDHERMNARKFDSIRNWYATRPVLNQEPVRPAHWESLYEVLRNFYNELQDLHDALVRRT